METFYEGRVEVYSYSHSLNSNTIVGLTPLAQFFVQELTNASIAHERASEAFSQFESIPFVASPNLTSLKFRKRLKFFALPSKFGGENSIVASLNASHINSADAAAQVGDLVDTKLVNFPFFIGVLINSPDLYFLKINPINLGLMLKYRGLVSVLSGLDIKIEKLKKKFFKLKLKGIREHQLKFWQRFALFNNFGIQRFSRDYSVTIKRSRIVLLEDFLLFLFLKNFSSLVVKPDQSLFFTLLRRELPALRQLGVSLVDPEY
jgi:hypothetical protein